MFVYALILLILIVYFKSFFKTLLFTLFIVIGIGAVGEHLFIFVSQIILAFLGVIPAMYISEFAERKILLSQDGYTMLGTTLWIVWIVVVISYPIWKLS